MITIRAASLPIGVATMLATARCTAPDQATREGPSRATAETTRLDSLEPGALGTVQSEAVEGWTGPGGRPFEVALRTAAREGGHARRFGTIGLPVVLRVRGGALSQYPCTSCHQGRRIVMTDKRVGDAHQNIRPGHPERTGGLCGSCHRADDVSRLVVQGQGAATLDQSYRLCAQCHFAQSDAWAGGAHGKRLDGWQGRRVVMACTDCHDPHAPAAEPRIPFRAPDLHRTRRESP